MIEVGGDVQRSRIRRQRRAERITVHREGAHPAARYEIHDGDVLGELIGYPGAIAGRLEHDARGGDAHANDARGRERLELQALEHGRVQTREPGSTVPPNRHVERIPADPEPGVVHAEGPAGASCPRATLRGAGWA